MEPLGSLLKPAGWATRGLSRERVAELKAAGKARATAAAERVKAGVMLYGDNPWPLTPVLAETTEEAWQRWGFLKGQRPKTFAEFKPSLQPEAPGRRKAAEALTAVQAWSRAQARPFLTLSGPSGTGKTHLAEAATLAANEAGRFCRYLTAYEFDRQVKDFRRDDEQSEAIMRPDDWVDLLAGHPMLVIDDIGAGYIDRGWTLTKFERLFDLRYRLKMPTLATTNLSAAEFEQHCGQRIWSRLFDSELGVVIAGEEMADLRA